MSIKSGRKVLLASVVLAFIGFLGQVGSAKSGELPINERPMYGGMEQSPTLQVVNEKLKNDIRSSGVPFEKAADNAVQRGWQAMQKRDFATAMKRFNQAWLLDPTNGHAYWGMAAVVSDRDNDIKQANSLFKKALELKASDPVLLVDYGRFMGRVRWLEQSQGDVDAANQAQQTSINSFHAAT